MFRRYNFLTIAVLFLLLVAGQVNGQSTLPTVTWKKLMDKPVLGVSISPDGAYIFYGEETKFNPNFALFDWQAKKFIWETSTDIAGLMTVHDWSAWSPDGKYIAIIAHGDVFVLDSKDGSHVVRLETVLKANNNLLRMLNFDIGFGYTDLKWNADSDQLAVMGWGYVLVYNLPSGSLKTVVELSPYVGSGSSLWRFDWSPDGSKFAAFTFKTENYRAVIPAEIVIGFWDKNGRRLYDSEQSETPTALKQCVRNDMPLQYLEATDVAWSPDGKQIAVSAGGYTVCTPQADGSLIVTEIPDYFPNALHWSANQKWLFAFSGGCSLLITDVMNSYATHAERLESDCIFYSANWSQDDRHIVVRTGGSGLWLGEVTY